MKIYIFFKSVFRTEFRINKFRIYLGPKTDYAYNGIAIRLEFLQRLVVQLSERLASLGIMGALEHHSTMILRGSRGALVGPPWCREPVSRTAVRLIIEK